MDDTTIFSAERRRYNVNLKSRFRMNDDVCSTTELITNNVKREEFSCQR